MICPFSEAANCVPSDCPLWVEDEGCAFYVIAKSLLKKQEPPKYVGTKSCLNKVASFGNDMKAELFCKYLEFVTGITDEPPKEDADANERL